MDIRKILQTKYSGSQWLLNGEDYSGLEWLDDSAKPSKKDLESLWEEVKLEVDLENVRVLRRLAYQVESDPLFFGWQRGDNTEQEWLEAIQAIKDSHPYPEQA
jgi:hypothetical protein